MAPYPPGVQRSPSNALSETTLYNTKETNATTSDNRGRKRRIQCGTDS